MSNKEIKHAMQTDNEILTAIKYSHRKNNYFALLKEKTNVNKMMIRAWIASHMVIKDRVCSLVLEHDNLGEEIKSMKYHTNGRKKSEFQKVTSKCKKRYIHAKKFVILINYLLQN